MNIIKEKPDKPSFSQKGLNGFKFNLENKDVEVSIMNVEIGHETYFISKKCWHIYYIIEGEGIFEINGKKIEVKKDMLIEVPPKIEYTYTGKMKLLLIMNPPWFEGNEEHIRKNPAVE
jgi:mannose-6-phosphate isomerase-like protein (cupin superfamily)